MTARTTAEWRAFLDHPRAPDSPATLRAYAAITRRARQAAHAAIVTVIVKMLANDAEFNRVEPRLADMQSTARVEHCRDLFQACRREAIRSHGIYPRTDAINVRAAYVAAWIAERRERAEMRRAA